jgi:hypothetical protein
VQIDRKCVLSARHKGGAKCPQMCALVAV